MNPDQLTTSEKAEADSLDQDKATPIPTPLLPDLGPAPEFTNEVWLNTERPLTLKDLQGKVVLVEFWTFG